MAQNVSCTVLETVECGDTTIVLFGCGARVSFQFFQHDLPTHWIPFIDTTIKLQTGEVTANSAPCPRLQEFDQAIPFWCMREKGWISTPCWLVIRAENDRSQPWQWKCWARQIQDEAIAKSYIAATSQETAIVPQYSLYDVAPDFCQDPNPVNLCQPIMRSSDWISQSNLGTFTSDSYSPVFSNQAHMMDTYTPTDISQQLFPSSLYNLETPAASPDLSMKSLAADPNCADSVVKEETTFENSSERAPRDSNPNSIHGSPCLDKAAHGRKSRNGVTKRHIPTLRNSAGMSL